MGMIFLFLLILLAGVFCLVSAALLATSALARLRGAAFGPGLAAALLTLTSVALDLTGLFRNDWMDRHWTATIMRGAAAVMATLAAVIHSRAVIRVRRRDLR